MWFEKGDVNGANTREVFSYLKQQLPNSDKTSDIRWNFATFLVDHEGKPFKRFTPTAEVYDKVKPKLEDLMKKQAEEAK